jgi:hypothetical protein
MVEFPRFCSKGGRQKSGTCDVAAGPVEAGDQTARNWVSPGSKNEEWSSLPLLLQCLNRLKPR